MRKFLKKIIAFFIVPIIIILICVTIYGTSIPNLSNSLSFNDKMHFLKEKKLDTSLGILAVGSSMTLNNIHSKSIAKYLDSAYVNSASWGQSIADDFKMIKILAPLYKPKTIIVTSNFMDFQNEWSKIKFDRIEPYLSDTFTLTGFDLRYNLKNANKLQEFKQNKTLYDYLKYDKHGGINLNANHLKIDSLRWKGRVIGDSKLDIIQYRYLDSISNFCNSKNIDLVFVQSPFREGFYSKLKEEQKNYLNDHIQKVDSIVSLYNQQFIDTSSSRPWPDSLFADYSHLNAKGAQLFTSLFLDEIKRDKETN